MSIKKWVDKILKERERKIEAQIEKLRTRYETEMDQLKKKKDSKLMSSTVKNPFSRMGMKAGDTEMNK